MKTVYLHIGQTKTATSSLQKLFSGNREWLANHGVFYPHVPERSGLLKEQHRFLVDSLYHNSGHFDSAKLDWDFITKQIYQSSLDKILISEELFWHLFENNHEKRKKAIEWIKEYLSDFQVKVICYLRRQDSWIDSWYNQLVKTDVSKLSCMEIEEFVDFYKKNGLLNYDDVLSEWSAQFGAENIIVRPFEKAQLKNNDILHDFCSLLSISDLEGITCPVEHVSLKSSACAFSLIYNRTKKSKQFKPRIDTMMRKLSEDVKSGEKFLPKSIAQELLILAKESNKKVAEKYLNSHNLFHDNDVSNDYQEYSGLNVDELAEILSFIFIEQQSDIRNLRKKITDLENSII
jgi:hypothetical protein